MFVRLKSLVRSDGRLSNDQCLTRLPRLTVMFMVPLCKMTVRTDHLTIIFITHMKADQTVMAAH